MARDEGKDPFADRRVEPGVEVKMSATLVLRHLDAFRAELGVDVVDAAIARQPTAVREELDALVSGAWFACDRVDAIYDSLAAITGRDVEELLPVAAERGNVDAFSSVWKALMRMAPGRLLIKRASAMFEKSYTHGKLTATDVGQDVQLDLTHWPNVPRNRILGTAAGIRAVLRLAGRSDAQVEHERPPDGARFMIRL